MTQSGPFYQQQQVTPAQAVQAPMTPQQAVQAPMTPQQVVQAPMTVPTIQTVQTVPTAPLAPQVPIQQVSQSMGQQVQQQLPPKAAAYPSQPNQQVPVQGSLPQVNSYPQNQAVQSQQPQPNPQGQGFTQQTPNGNAPAQQGSNGQPTVHGNQPVPIQFGTPQSGSVGLSQDSLATQSVEWMVDNWQTVTKLIQ